MKIEQSQLELASRSSLVREEVRIRQESPAAAAPVRISTAAAPPVDLELDLAGKELLMRLIAEMMLGKAHTFRVADPGGVAVTAGDAPQVQVRNTVIRVEAEEVQFAAKGSVQTSDGRTIDFEANLQLSRQFVQVLTGEAADRVVDPLVLNFDGKGVRLAGSRSAPVVAPGSGVLFADRNGDGVAGDGSELFGPQTGDGFGELAQQDSDQNGWIDESDPVFGELRVWFQDPHGAGSVYSLADLGVGAISTANVGTQFDLRNAGTGLLGQIRASGVYLKENGQAGVISRIDLTA